MQLFRHAGLDPASRMSRKHWILAFAGMTHLFENDIYGQTLLIEMKAVPLQIILEDEASADLLEIYEKEGFIRKGARMDLRHLAVATVNGVDAVVSWNFRDMVNIRTRRSVHSINLRLGFPLIEIVSPEEVIGYEE